MSTTRISSDHEPHETQPKPFIEILDWLLYKAQAASPRRRLVTVEWDAKDGAGRQSVQAYVATHSADGGVFLWDRDPSVPVTAGNLPDVTEVPFAQILAVEVSS